MIRGRFIVLEGCDGAGTTTQAQLLGEALKTHGIDCLVTREPTDSQIGRLIRLLLAAGGTAAWETMAHLFTADRHEHVRTVINPALQAGKWVICDRYILSSLIYQTIEAARHGPPRNPMRWLQSLNDGFPTPDLTYVLDVSAEVAAKRRFERGGSVELYDRPDFQDLVIASYRRADLFGLPRDRIIHIDGELPASDVHMQILLSIKRLTDV